MRATGFFFSLLPSSPSSFAHLISNEQIMTLLLLTLLCLTSPNRSYWGEGQSFRAMCSEGSGCLINVISAVKLERIITSSSVESVVVIILIAPICCKGATQGRWREGSGSRRSRFDPWAFSHLAMGPQGNHRTSLYLGFLSYEMVVAPMAVIRIKKMITCTYKEF